MPNLTVIDPTIEHGDVDEPFFTATEVANQFRISKGKVHLMERSGELRGVRIGRCVRFPRSAVQEWIVRNYEAQGR